MLEVSMGWVARDVWMSFVFSGLAGALFCMVVMLILTFISHPRSQFVYRLTVALGGWSMVTYLLGVYTMTILVVIIGLLLLVQPATRAWRQNWK